MTSESDAGSDDVWVGGWGWGWGELIAVRHIYGATMFS